MKNYLHSYLFKLYVKEIEEQISILSSIRNYNSIVPRIELQFCIIGIASYPASKGYVDEFHKSNKSDLLCSVVAIKLVLRHYDLPSTLLELRSSNYFANRFSISISKLLAHLAIY